jgi:hypothetical protein
VPDAAGVRHVHAEHGKELELDRIDIDTEVVTGVRAPVLSLPLEGLSGPGGLPRALFVHEVLKRDGCAVATASAEREGEELTVAEMEKLGEPLRASVDQHGVREALLRAEGETPLLLRRSRGAIDLSVAAADVAGAQELAESLAAGIRVEPKPRDTRVAVAFWSGTGGDVFSGPHPRWRRLALPRFAEVEHNYPATVRAGLAELFARTSGDGLPGRLALWHGPPGTGKTWALRALGREWKDWCDLHYVTDPERLLSGDTSYMLEVLAGRSEPLDLDLDDLDDLEETPRRARERWRLLVLEDAGELLGISAPAEVGRGFARLLNIADGLLGQGTRALILVTTNEPLGKLHPAALRPGRAMATLEFAPLAPAEAGAWLAERGLERRPTSPATIAELHALLAGSADEAAGQARVPVGFG